MKKHVYTFTVWGENNVMKWGSVEGFRDAMEVARDLWKAHPDWRSMRVENATRIGFVRDWNRDKFFWIEQ